MSVKGWIGVDLDGTLAYYDNWRGEAHIGRPIPEMVERVQRWIEEGKYNVKIFTARVSGEGADEVRKTIELWAAEHIGHRLEVTCMKDYAMVELWDDRAVTVEHNTGKLLTPSTRGL